MRAFSLMLSFGLVVGGSSFAGAPDGDLPGVGTFQYSGSSVATTVAQQSILAARF